MKSKILTANDIRKSVLQLAIQGKLVKQNPNDEPAIKLIEKIYKEKQQLIKEGKIKKDKNESYIFRGNDGCFYEKIGKQESLKIDVPFEIPSNWEWARAKLFSSIYTGNSINADVKKTKYSSTKGLDFISTPDVGFDGVIKYNNGINIPLTETKFAIAPANKVLICIEGGSAGKKIGITDRNVCFGNKLACFNSICINDEFLYCYIKSPIFSSIFKESLSGMIPGVNINELKNMLVPLPPLEEQKRIVDKINKIEKLLVEYEKIEKKLSYLEDNIEEQLKKSILQYAIQGKLVKQDLNDEPASKLIERIYKEKQQLIKEGKLKKDKNESYIFRGNDGCFYEKIGKHEPVKIDVPFEIPSNWMWVKSINLIDVLSGNSYKKEDICSSGLRILRGGNIKNFKINLQDNDVFLPSNKYLQKNKLIEKHDIVVVASTGSKEVIGNPAFVYDIIPNCSIGAFLRIVRPRFEWCFDYLSVFYRSEYYRNIIRKETSGTCINNLGSSLLLNILIPLPPLEEQKRIVDKINKIEKIMIEK